jgi:type IV pilus assembly protein PilO
MRFGLRELIFVFILLGFPAAALFYVFIPRNNAINQALQDIEIKQAKLDSLDATTAELEGLDQEIQKLLERIRILEEKLPDGDDVEEILEQVWLIAKQNNLTVKGVSSEKPVETARYQELPLKMVLEGKFDGYYQFLLELERLPRITRIHELEIIKAGAEQKGLAVDDIAPGTMRAEFLLSIFFESPETTIQ